MQHTSSEHEQIIKHTICVKWRQLTCRPKWNCWRNESRPRRNLTQSPTLLKGKGRGQHAGKAAAAKRKGARSACRQGCSFEAAHGVQQQGFAVEVELIFQWRGCSQEVELFQWRGCSQEDKLIYQWPGCSSGGGSIEEAPAPTPRERPRAATDAATSRVPSQGPLQGLGTQR